MTHSPPVPPANQSPYPIAEPPHPHPPEPPVTAVAKNAPADELRVSPGLIIGAVTAIAAVAAGVTALLLHRREKPAAKPRRPRKRKA